MEAGAITRSMKLVIFDCDGTLVDSQNGIVAAMDFAFREGGLAPPARIAVLGVVGLSLPEAFAALAPDQPESVRERLRDHYRSAFTLIRQNRDHDEPMFPGMRAVVEELAARDDIVLGVATGKSRRGVDRLFTREGFHSYFATVQTADGHPSKPHPSMIEAAMRQTAVPPEATVMIGDTTFDIEMAGRAGVRALGVSWGYHRVEQLERAGADRIVHEAATLIGAIDDLLRGGTAT